MWRPRLARRCRRERWGFFPLLRLPEEEVVGRALSLESGCLRSQPKAGGKLHLRLNTSTRPIENKYREGKLK